MTAPLHAFAAYGIELEYMIVDRASLDVRPVADRLLTDAAGEAVDEVERGRLAWSNELTLHLVELKNRRPDADLAGLAAAFQAEVGELDRRLAAQDARLMPTGMHPWMDPAQETRLWPHRHAAIYRCYDRIFGCRQHGFANLQSMHLNLPFADDAEFARLHAAIRILLPILPALAASSPIADGEASGLLDTRLAVYRGHQARIPESIGRVVPEAVCSRAGYETCVLAPMYRAIHHLDGEGVLRHEWLNARGAVPRFERMALEIRLIDCQEHPAADLAIAAAVVEAARRLYDGGHSDTATQNAYPTDRLVALLDACQKDADQARVDDPAYLALFGLPAGLGDAGAVWRRLIEAWWETDGDAATTWGDSLGIVLARGPLARRILQALDGDLRRPRLESVYRRLCDCLAAGRPFLAET